MKRRKLHWFSAILCCSVLILFAFRETLLYRIGTFLVVADQPVDKVDAVVTGKVTEKVAQCYHAGNCKKVVLIVDERLSPAWWKNIPKAGNGKTIIEESEAAGIKPADLIVFRLTRGTGHVNELIPLFGSLRGLFLEREIRSALFYAIYYKTRRHRFFLDRYLNGPGITTYVQPASDDYSRNFERWWENTMLDNLFMDEYLRIAFYYFNKILWSPAV